MPLIPNYIARLRTHSQSTAASSSSHSGSHSNSTAGPSTPGSELARLAEDPLAEQPPSASDQTPRSLIGRKIHPDPSTLVDENVPSQPVAEDLGPRPPKRRSRSEEQLGTTRQVASQDATQTQDREPSESAVPPLRSPRSPFLSRILSVPLFNSVSTPPSDANLESGNSTTHWSTFGRRRPPGSTGEFGSLSRRGSGTKGSSPSKSSRRHQKSAPPSTTSPPSVSARTGTPSRAQTTETGSSQQNSPAGTISSSAKSYSGQSHSLRSRRPPPGHSEPIPDSEYAVQLDPLTPARAPLQTVSFSPSPDVASPPAARQTLDDSPQTFGRATPKVSDINSKQYLRVSDALVTPTSDFHQQRRKVTSREPAATFPLRKRKRSRPTTGSLVRFPSLTHSTPSAGLHGEDGFKASDERRFSANWSAAEAVKGGGGGRQGESWPATVSREMVRLSLGGRSAAVGGDVVVAVGEEGALAEANVKNVTLFGSTGEDRRRFMRAERKRANTGSAVLAQVSSFGLEQSPPQPALSVSPPTGSGSAPDTATGDKINHSGLAPQVSVTAPTPSTSPRGSRIGTISDPTPWSRTDGNPPSGEAQGKRKIADAEEEEPSGRPNTGLLHGSRNSSNRASDASHAPSSYRQPKRIRLSAPSRERSLSQSSRTSPPASPRSRPPSSLRTLPNTTSQTSIPLRAIVSPRPPSVDRRSNYHMRDPGLPPPLRQSTQWAGGARRSEDGYMTLPLQGWAFVLGFVLFPVWWVAAVVPVRWGWAWRRRTRMVHDGNGALVKDGDSEVREIWEYDVAFTWRRRCRLMSILGLLVYIPIIVLLSVLVPRT